MIGGRQTCGEHAEHVPWSQSSQYSAESPRHESQTLRRPEYAVHNKGLSQNNNESLVTHFVARNARPFPSTEPTSTAGGLRNSERNDITEKMFIGGASTAVGFALKGSGDWGTFEDSLQPIGQASQTLRGPDC